MIKLNDYNPEDFWKAYAKLWAPNGAAGVVWQPFKLNGNIAGLAGGSDTYYDFSQPSAIAAPASPPDNFTMVLFGNLYVRWEIASAAANGSCRAAAYDPTNQFGALFALTARTITAGSPDGGGLPNDVAEYQDIGFQFIRLTVAGAANSCNFYIKFDGIKISWGA